MILPKKRPVVNTLGALTLLLPPFLTLFLHFCANEASVFKFQDAKAPGLKVRSRSEPAADLKKKALPIPADPGPHQGADAFLRGGVRHKRRDLFDRLSRLINVLRYGPAQIDPFAFPEVFSDPTPDIAHCYHPDTVYEKNREMNSPPQKTRRAGMDQSVKLAVTSASKCLPVTAPPPQS